ncbi:MAG: glycosyltransferase [Nitrospiraceae bacterium]
MHRLDGRAGLDAQRITGWRQVRLSDPADAESGEDVSAARLAPVARLERDVVHVHYLRGLAWGLAASMPHPHVLTPWGSDVLPDQGAFREWYSSGLTRRLLKRAILVCYIRHTWNPPCRSLLQTYRGWNESGGEWTWIGFAPARRG